jgi:hypothetical protein
MNPLAVRAYFMSVAAYCSLFECPPDHVAHVLAQSVRSGTLAAHWLMVPVLALDVAPSPVQIAETVRAQVCVRFDYVSYSCSNYAFVHQSLYNVLPPPNEDPR